MQNFAAVPPKEGWSRAQISIILLHGKKSSFPLIKPQIKRKLVIFWALKVISHFFLSYFNKGNQKYQQSDHILGKKSVLLALTRVRITQQTDTKIIQNIFI